MELVSNVQFEGVKGNLLTLPDPKFENGCYTWPMPEMEAERWRYVNVKECRNALVRNPELSQLSTMLIVCSIC